MKKFIPYIAIAVLILLFFRQCEETSNVKEQNVSAINFLQDSVRYLKNSLGAEIASKTALQGGKTSLQVLLSKQIDSTGQLKSIVRKFRTVQAAGNITIITKIDSIPVPYEVPVPCEFSRTWSKIDKFYSIYGKSNQFGNIIDSLSVPNLLSFAIGDKKVGFLKTEYRIETANSNPYIRTIGLDAYTLSLPVKRLGLSLYAGVGFSTNFEFTPQIGVGLSYTFIRF